MPSSSLKPLLSQFEGLLLFRHVLVFSRNMGKRSPTIKRNPAGAGVHGFSALAKGLILVSLAILPTVSDAGIVPRDTPERFELEFWRAIKDSSDPEEFAAYLEAYPQGRFSTLAKIRAKSLSRSLKTPADKPAVTTPAAKSTEQPPATDETAQPPADSAVINAEAESTQSAPVANTEPAATTEPVAAAERTETVKPRQKAAAEPNDKRRKLMATQAFRDCALCPMMVEIPTGEFIMGDDASDKSSGPAHSVTIDYSIAAGAFEITHSQWNFCVEQGGCQPNSRLSSLQGQQPAINLSWLDARDYTIWLSEFTRRPYRLPTEAEWEYVARAGTTTRYWWGDEIIPDSANCRDCGGNFDRKLPAPTDAFVANAFGLYSTSGGVSEWVTDCWKSSHADAPGNGAAVQINGCNTRVLRGGSWRNDKSYLTSASRLSYDHNVRYSGNGLRVVLDYDDLMEDL